MPANSKYFAGTTGRAVPVNSRYLTGKGSTYDLSVIAGTTGRAVPDVPQ